VAKGIDTDLDCTTTASLIKARGYQFVGRYYRMSPPYTRKKRNYSPRVGWSRGGNLGGGWCQGVADGGESVAALAAAGFDN
jgi:hypothetical protein